MKRSVDFLLVCPFDILEISQQYYVAVSIIKVFLFPFHCVFAYVFQGKKKRTPID